MQLHHLTFLTLRSAVVGQSPISVANTATCSSAVAAAAATARTDSWTSNMCGRAFDRILIVYLETTSFDHAVADPLIENGILSSNMYGVAAPSQPNYIAAASGDTFGLNSDSFILVNKKVSTIIDLLEERGISWGDYNEGLPYTGFEGYKYDPGLYERKHNLLARFDNIRLNPDRISRVKNMSMFYKELDHEQLPQWIFVTPNLYNDGHNTDIRTSCAWTRGFVESLLQDKYFNNNTLVYVTWQVNGDDENVANHVAGILLGSAIPQRYVGTTDKSYYNHHSEISSVEANWGLHTLGRWDVGANVWKFVGERTGDRIREWNPTVANGSFDSYLWNQSYGGVFSNANKTTHTYVAPNVKLQHNGRSVLPAIVNDWGNSSLPSYYKDIVELPDAFHPPLGFAIPIPLTPPVPITTPITAYPYANPPATTSTVCVG